MNDEPRKGSKESRETTPTGVPIGAIEMEFGVPIPGVIARPERWTQTALKKLPEPGPLDWAELFGRVAPVVIELGCGNARWTLQSALRRPDVDHVGVDVLPVVIRYATRRANQRGIPNARFVVKDAETFVERYVPDGSVEEIHLYHPQPYRDPRQAHRRQVAPRFLAEVWRALKPGGLFVAQTDNPDYWAYMEKILPVFFEWHEEPGPWPDMPEGRSRREIIARSRGLRIFRGWGTKRAELDQDAARREAELLPAPTFRTSGPWYELDAIEAAGDAGPKKPSGPKKASGPKKPSGPRRLGGGSRGPGRGRKR